MHLSRRQILTLLLATAATPICAEARPPKRVIAPQPKDISGLLAQYAPSGTHSIVVADAVSGRVIEDSNGDKSIPPASVGKALTTIYALQNLGENWRFRTRLVGSGSRIVNDILQGDLTLEGGGDPALDTDGLADLLKQLRARGIKGISGKLHVYAGALPYQRLLDREQQEHVGYNPTISGINLNFNRAFLEWKRNGNGYGFTFSAKTEAYKPVVNGVSIRAVNRKEPIYKYSQSGGHDSWTVSASALGNKGNRWLPIRNPADYAGEVFATLAAEFGITLPPASPVLKAPKGAVLASGKSAPLNAVCKSMLKYSTNLTAETVGLSATIKRGGKPSSVAQSARTMSDWLRDRFGLRDVRMVDHSGLSEDSRITAREMARVLSTVGWNGSLRPLMKPIVLRNADWKKAPISGVNVTGKTGTLNFTSALAGYLVTASGRRMVYVIFTVDQRARAAIPKSKRDRAPGAKEWARKSRVMQHQLLARWGRVL